MRLRCRVERVRRLRPPPGEEGRLVVILVHLARLAVGDRQHLKGRDYGEMLNFTKYLSSGSTAYITRLDQLTLSSLTSYVEPISLTLIFRVAICHKAVGR